MLAKIPQQPGQLLKTAISKELLLNMYEMMLRIRLAEEKIADLITAKEIICPCHLYIGQEAVAVGVCFALRKDDFVFSTHRSHGHYLAKGGSLKKLFAELLAKVTGCSRGKGGSMHLVDMENGFPGSSSIVGGCLPLAVGAALAFKLENSDRVSAVFFGDGATDEGVFWESINFAALKKLPVIFACENNLYATHMPMLERQPLDNLAERVSKWGIPSKVVDGNKVTDVYESAVEAVRRARTGEGPTFIEYRTYRWRGHVGPNWDVDKGLRSQEEIDYWIARCPVNQCGTLCTCEYDSISEATLAEIRTKIEKEIEEALDFARNSPVPPAEEVLMHLFKEREDR